MKITIFTSNNLRHNFLINVFSKHFKKIYVFQETRSLFPGQYNSHYKKSKFIKKYFDKVQKAQLKFLETKILCKIKKCKYCSVKLWGFKFNIN